MTLQLRQANFVNDTYKIRYNNNAREAEFRIVDEEFTAIGHLVTMNRIIIFITEYDSNGDVQDTYLKPSIIGIGDGIVGVQSDIAALRGKVLSKDNMESCTVELYESE
jgi:hypothetical protein